MSDSVWASHELGTLEWFVKKGEQYRQDLAQQGAQDTGGKAKWSWSFIAKKMQKVADRDEWESKRKYDASNCELAWQTVQSRTAEVKVPEVEFPEIKVAEIKVEPKDEFESNDQRRSKVEDHVLRKIDDLTLPNVQQELGDNFDPLSFKAGTAIVVQPSLEPTGTPTRDVSIPPTGNPQGPFQVRFENGLDSALDYRFDYATNSFIVTPKATAPIDPAYFESEAFIRDEQASRQALNSAQDTARALTNNSRSPAALFQTRIKRSRSSSLADTKTPPRSILGDSPVRRNARWEDHELAALMWFASKQIAEQKSNIQGRTFVWTWKNIAEKMNKVAARDGWDTSRAYTAGNCAGAYGTNATRLPHGRPSASRRSGTPVKRGGRTKCAPKNEQRGERVILDTFNPPPPGPDAGVSDQAPYHWLLAERQALHEVYVFSRIAENKLLSRGECRRRGNWTWTMVAREMNARSVGAPWYVGRVYDQSNCYNMIKYEKENFNLKGNVQPWSGDAEEKDEGEDEEQ